jgi:hypothetical protein
MQKLNGFDMPSWMLSADGTYPAVAAEANECNQGYREKIEELAKICETSTLFPPPLWASQMCSIVRG